MTHTTDPSQFGREPSRLDQLIDAIVDGSAQDGQWDEFRALAGMNAEPWRRLAQEQRLMKTLEAGFHDEVRRAMSVELPAQQALISSTTNRPVASWRPALGWAAAAILGLAWAGSTLLPQSRTHDSNPDTLLVQYMAQPHVVGELPIEITDVSTTDGGEFVTYVRQIVERRPVNLYNLQLDENSNPVLRQASSEPVLLASRY